MRLVSNATDRWVFTICNETPHDKGFTRFQRVPGYGWGGQPRNDGCWAWVDPQSFITLLCPLLCMLKIVQKKKKKKIVQRFCEELGILPKETCSTLTLDHTELLNFCRGYVYSFSTKWHGAYIPLRSPLY